MGISNQILGLILSLSILVFLHELGHFFFARLFKTRVEKFYLFFNPGFSLIRAKRYNKKWHFSLLSKSSPEEWSQHPDATEWGLGWLPFGGYCAIAGMVDETKKANELPAEPQPFEYRSKKAWQRLLIISGGVITNFVLALVVFSAVFFIWGTETLPIKNATMGYNYTQVLLDNGFKNGDKILTIEGKNIDDIGEVSKLIIIDNAQHITVERNDSTVNITLPETVPQELLAKNVKALAEIRYPFIIEECAKGSPANKAGILPNDRIVGINDSIATPAFSDFTAQMSGLKNTAIILNIARNNKNIRIPLQTTEEGTIGAYAVHPSKILKTEKKTYTFFESIPAGISLGWNTLTGYVSSMKLIFTKEGSKQVGGFISIGGIFPKTWDWSLFWERTALLSIILAFMNVLPIPALDGGHIMFTLFEMVTGRKPSEKFLERAQMVGMVLLFGLLIFANMNDIIKLFTK